MAPGPGRPARWRGWRWRCSAGRRSPRPGRRAAAGARHRGAARRLRRCSAPRRHGPWRRMRSRHRRRLMLLRPPAGWSPGWCWPGWMPPAAMPSAPRCAACRAIPPSLAFGLKPAASAMALWLPLVAAAPLACWLRGLVLLARRGGAGAAAGRIGQARRRRRAAGRRRGAGCWHAGSRSPSARSWPGAGRHARWRSARCWRAACRRRASRPRRRIGC